MTTWNVERFMRQTYWLLRRDQLLYNQVHTATVHCPRCLFDRFRLTHLPTYNDARTQRQACFDAIFVRVVRMSASWCVICLESALTGRKSATPETQTRGSYLAYVPRYVLRTTTSTLCVLVRLKFVPPEAFKGSKLQNTPHDLTTFSRYRGRT